MLKVNVMHGLMQTKRTQKMLIHNTRHMIHKSYACSVFFWVDGLLTSNSLFSRYGWSVGNEKLLGLRNKGRCLSSLHSELDAFIWSMENVLQHITCQYFWMDFKDVISIIQNPTTWPSFSTKLARDSISTRTIPRFQDHSHTKRENRISYTLAKIKRVFHWSLVLVFLFYFRLNSHTTYTMNNIIDFWCKKYKTQ